MFRRQQQTTQTPPEKTSPDATADAEQAAKSGGKGRPTPKRSEAERKRAMQRKPPTDRKEAYRRQREVIKESRKRSREALIKGDERHLPPRDAGPVRGFTRDYIDVRRGVAGIFLPAALVILIISIMPLRLMQYLSSVLFIVFTGALVIDEVRMIRGLKRELRKRYPDESLRGVTPYALMRSMQVRRLRLPPPRVQRGASL